MIVGLFMLATTIYKFTQKDNGLFKSLILLYLLTLI